MLAIDFAALSEPYDKKAGQRLAYQLRTTVPTRRRFVPTASFIDIFGGVVFGFAAVMLGPIGLIYLVVGIVEGNGDQIGPGIAMLLSAVGFGAFAYWLLHRYFRSTGSPELWWRLDRFARANGLVFAPWSPEPAYPSALFSAGVGAAAYSHVRHEGEGFYNIGNLYYQTGKRGNESFDNRWGFVAIHLEQTWPAMLLDSKVNDRLGMNGLPFDLADTRQLSLTGPGADTFVLRGTPTGQSRAKQVFTPALVEALAKATGTYDAHVVDDWLFIFSRTEFDMADPALLRELFGFVDLVRGSKA